MFWLGVLVIGFPVLALCALALWLVALSRRLPYAANHDPEEHEDPALDLWDVETESAQTLSWWFR